MSRTFRRVGDGVRATFHPAEVELIRRLHEELITALEVRDPDDPVIRRLFPPAVLGDAAAEAQLRALFDDALLADRLSSLGALVEILDRGTSHRGKLRVDLVEDEPLVVLRVLNDVRLAIGARIDIEALDRDDVTAEDPEAYPLAIMDHLAWWQEQIVSIIDPPSTSHTTTPEEPA